MSISLEMVQIGMIVGGGTYIAKVIERRQRLFARCLLLLIIGEYVSAQEIIENEYPDLRD